MTDTNTKQDHTGGSIMTTTAQPETTATQSVDLQQLVGAEIVTINDHGLPATKRCASCEAQAYLEVEVYDSQDRIKRVLEFCGHHYTKNEHALVMQAVRVVDYRPYLLACEAKMKGKIA